VSQEPARGQALELRARLKAKKPKFRRQESWRYKRVSQVWRKPDGIDSKMKRRKKGWPKTVDAGYRGPKEARGLHPSGYEEMLVRNVDDLAKIDPKVQAVRIAHTVGMKKRAEISLLAGERHIYILNPLPEEKPTEEAEETAEEEAKAEEKSEEEEKATEPKSEAKGKPETAQEKHEEEEAT